MTNSELVSTMPKKVEVKSTRSHNYGGPAHGDYVDRVP